MRSRVRTPANFCIRFARTGRLQALLGSLGALQELSWALLGSPGALLGSEIVQMACRLPEPRAREDVMRSRVWTPAIFCIRFARTGRLQALLGSPGASWALLGYPGFSLALKSSKWHARRRSLARARMSCDHASGPRQISAYVSLAQGGSKLSWALMGLSRGSPRLSWGSPGFWNRPNGMLVAGAPRARGCHAITRPDPCKLLHTFRSHRVSPSSPGLSWGSPGALLGLSWALVGSVRSGPEPWNRPRRTPGARRAPGEYQECPGAKLS
jgi:hypothetical protein